MFRQRIIYEPENTPGQFAHIPTEIQERVLHTLLKNFLRRFRKSGSGGKDALLCNFLGESSEV